jgi:hypothetical protein
VNSIQTSILMQCRSIEPGTNFSIDCKGLLS